MHKKGFAEHLPKILIGLAVLVVLFFFVGNSYGDVGTTLENIIPDFGESREAKVGESIVGIDLSDNNRVHYLGSDRWVSINENEFKLNNYEFRASEIGSKLWEFYIATPRKPAGFAIWIDHFRTWEAVGGLGSRVAVREAVLEPPFETGPFGGVFDINLVNYEILGASSHLAKGEDRIYSEAISEFRTWFDQILKDGEAESSVVLEINGVEKKYRVEKRDQYVFVNLDEAVSEGDRYDSVSGDAVGINRNLDGFVNDAEVHISFKDGPVDYVGADWVLDEAGKGEWMIETSDGRFVSAFDEFLTRSFIFDGLAIDYFHMPNGEHEDFYEGLKVIAEYLSNPNVVVSNFKEINVNYYKNQGDNEVKLNDEPLDIDRILTDGSKEQFLREVVFEYNKYAIPPENNYQIISEEVPRLSKFGNRGKEFYGVFYSGLEELPLMVRFKEVRFFEVKDFGSGPSILVLSSSVASVDENGFIVVDEAALEEERSTFLFSEAIYDHVSNLNGESIFALAGYEVFEPFNVPFDFPNGIFSDMPENDVAGDLFS